MARPEPEPVSLVESLARLMGKKLELAELRSEPGPSTVCHVSGSDAVTIYTSDDVQLSADERSVLDHVAGLLLRHREAWSEIRALDARLRGLENENVDLSVRNRALADISSRDSLTGLYARWYVMEKIEQEIHRSTRSGSPVALMMVDLDHFKQINDQFGHIAGDQVLQVVGHLMRESCRVYDVPGRYGGEEFCLMLPDTPLANTSIVAERIRSRFETTPVENGDRTLHFTASIGVAGFDATCDPSNPTSSSLIERADQALYAAKNRGRNRVEMWAADLFRDQGSGH